MGEGMDMPMAQPDAGEDTDLGQDDSDAGQDLDGEALGFAPTDMTALTYREQDGTGVWLLEAADGDTLLTFEIYENYGGPASPGTFDLAEVDSSYKTCGTCLVLETGCTAHDDHVHCQRTFMPRAQGKVRLDAIGENPGDAFSGQLLSLVFDEVTIAQDFTTGVVPDGRVLHLEAWAFDTQLEGNSGPQEECGGHGHLHGDRCHCDPGYRPDPQEPMNCVSD